MVISEYTQTSIITLPYLCLHMYLFTLYGFINAYVYYMDILDGNKYIHRDIYMHTKIYLYSIKTNEKRGHKFEENGEGYLQGLGWMKGNVEIL